MTLFHSALLLASVCGRRARCGGQTADEASSQHLSHPCRRHSAPFRLPWLHAAVLLPKPQPKCEPPALEGFSPDGLEGKFIVAWTAQGELFGPHRVCARGQRRGGVAALTHVGGACTHWGPGLQVPISASSPSPPPLPSVTAAASGTRNWTCSGGQPVFDGTVCDIPGGEQPGGWTRVCSGWRLPSACTCTRPATPSCHNNRLPTCPSCAP